MTRVAAGRKRSYTQRMARSAAARPAEGEAPRHSGRLLLRMPAALHAELAELARREGVSLNQFITTALTEASSGRRRAPAAGRPTTSTSVRLALAANLVALTIATALAVALLVLALRS